MQSQRRSYSKSFKAQVVQEYAQPGASIASVVCVRASRLA
ncbi:transposase [Pseudomonas sp. ACN5]